MKLTSMREAARGRAVFAIATIIFIDALGFSLMLPVLTLYAQSFGASAIMAGAVISTFAVFQLVAAPVLGRLSDVHGRRPVLMITLVGSALGFAVMASAQWVFDALAARQVGAAAQVGLGLLFVSRAINGITGGNMPVAQAYLADVTDHGSRVHAMGTISTAFALALGVGPLLAGHLALGGNFVVPALFGALASLSAAVLCWFILPETAPGTRQLHSAESLAHGTDASDAGLGAILDALRRPRTGALLVEWFLFVLCFAMFAYTFPLFAKGTFGLDTREIGNLFALMALLAIVWQLFVLGPLTARIGDGLLAVVGLCAFLACFALLATSVGAVSATSMPTIVSLALLFGIGFAAARPAITSALTKVVADDLAGSIMGVAQSLDSLATIIGPLLSGWLLDLRGVQALGVTAAVLVAGALGSAWVGRGTS